MVETSDTVHACISTRTTELLENLKQMTSRGRVDESGVRAKRQSLILRDVIVGASSRYGRATRTSLFSLDAHSLACGWTRRGSGHRLCYQYLALCPVFPLSRRSW